MFRKPELVWRVLKKPLGVGKAMCGVVLWCTKWAPPMATATTIQNHAPQQGCSIHCALVNPDAHHNTWQLQSLGSHLKICTGEKSTDSHCLASFQRGKIVGCTWKCLQRLLLVVRQETDRMSNGLSISIEIWKLGMMGIISKKRLALCLQVDGMWGEMFTALPIALQSRCKHVPNEHIPTCGYSWPQCQCVWSEFDTDKARRHSEAAIGGWYATSCMVLLPGTKKPATGVYLMALTEHILSDAAIPARGKCFLLM